jgi:predicted CoA-binding protein
MDPIFKQRVDNFLSLKNIAIAGYSSQKGQVANGLYDKFRKYGYKTYAINPKYQEIKDVDCFADLKSVPEKIDALMIATPPESSLELVKQCIELGIKHVWIHKSIDNGSYDKEAVELAEKSGIEIIPMACPMMFLKPDPFHFCFKWILDWRGKLKIQNN